MRKSKPKISDLKVAHRKLLVANSMGRIIALLEAVSWWDAQILYMINRSGCLDDRQIKIIHRADLMRKLSLGTTASGEKETALYQTLRQYEQLWPLESIPSIESAYALYEAQKDRLNRAEARMVIRYQKLVGVLNSAFQPSQVGFLVTKSDKAQRFDGAGRIILSTSKADDLLDLLRAEGPLSVIYAEAPAVARVAGIDRDTSGNRSFSVQKCMAHLPQIFDDIKKFCADYLVENKAHSLFKASSTASMSVSAPSPRAPRKPSGGPKIAGRYKPGSALAEYFKILADECHHSYQDLQAVYYVKFPKDTVWYIKDHGKHNGRWSVVQDKTGATLTIRDAAVRQELV